MTWYKLSQHVDNFVRDLITLAWVDDFPLPSDGTGTVPIPELPLSSPAGERESVLTLSQIKTQLRVEPDQTVEDDYLMQLEMAARIHTENSLRRPGQLNSDAPENIKLAMLVLIGHWYRNREAIIAGIINVAPLAYDALISTERGYSKYY